VLSAALGGQWRVGLTLDVTHHLALRTGSDKVNPPLPLPAAPSPFTRHSTTPPFTLHLKPTRASSPRAGSTTPSVSVVVSQKHLTLGQTRVLRSAITLILSDDPFTMEGRQKRRPAADTDVEAGDSDSSTGEGGHVRIWAGRRILLSTSSATAHIAQLKCVSNASVASLCPSPRMQTRMRRKRQSTNLAFSSPDNEVVSRISRYVLLVTMFHSHILVA